ncbi:MAG: hypothetical protein RLZZ127_1578 [Planctomycetota bacterium]|jgi:hypothetical protein
MTAQAAERLIDEGVEVLKRLRVLAVRIVVVLATHPLADHAP